MPEPAVAVSVRDLVKRYAGVEAVGGVSFDVAAGEIFGLLGPNGAGKTTTIECVLGLRHADAGSIAVAGIDAIREPGRVKRVLDKTKARVYMEQIGIFYHAYVAENGKPPAKLDDFLEYIKRDSRNEYQMLKEGSFVWNAKAGTDSNKALCYEKDPDLDDNRIVLMGDGSVQQMSTADFDKALPPKDR